jgi:hypothetical protein
MWIQSFDLFQTDWEIEYKKISVREISKWSDILWAPWNWPRLIRVFFRETVFDWLWESSMYFGWGDSNSIFLQHDRRKVCEASNLRSLNAKFSKYFIGRFWENRPIVWADPHTKYCNARKSYFYAITSTNFSNLLDQILGLKYWRISMARKTKFSSWSTVVPDQIFYVSGIPWIGL